MKMPKSLSVGVHKFKIKSNLQEDKILDEDENIGTCHTDSLEIVIHTKLPHTVEAETLLHEILHAIYDMSPDRSSDDAEEERIVQMFAPILLDVIRSNPKLIEYLVFKD